MVGSDPQMEFWMTVGLVAVVVALFFLFFYGWPSGGDPSKGGSAGGGDISGGI